MKHRLVVAGGSLALFSENALQSIAAGSGGVPRNVNTICFNALSLAFALNSSQVGFAEVAEVLRDLDLTPLPTKETLLPQASVVATPAPFFEPGPVAGARSLRPLLIAAAVLLLAAGSFWLRGLLGIVQLL